MTEVLATRQHLQRVLEPHLPPEVDSTYYMYYDLNIMTTHDEPRRITTIRLKPSAQRLAKIAAATTGVTIGEWIERAIAEKLERDGGLDG